MLTDERVSTLKELVSKLSYNFADYDLLNTALTHSSYANGDNRSTVHNERLEFLGDAVLELCVSDYLYRNYPDMNEGLMTRVRSRAVYEPALHKAAVELGLGEYLLLSHGEDNTGGRSKPSILSDALEAVIGAIYLDGGFNPAKKFILGFVENSVFSAIETVTVKDYKTLLQEYVQHKHIGELRYTVIGIDGPDHNRTFTMQVTIGDVVYGFGSGRTKQEASQMAAKITLDLLNRPTKEDKCDLPD